MIARKVLLLPRNNLREVTQKFRLYYLGMCYCGEQHNESNISIMVESDCCMTDDSAQHADVKGNESSSMMKLNPQ